MRPPVLAPHVDAFERKCADLLGVSCNGNKIITTPGGGMLVSDDAELIAQARKLATQARDPAPHDCPLSRHLMD